MQKNNCIFGNELDISSYLTGGPVILIDWLEGLRNAAASWQPELQV
jgi:hypothetical protein